MTRALVASRLVATALLLIFCRDVHAQHEGDLSIVASGVAGGTLVALGDFSTPLHVVQGFCSGGMCLYSTTDPGFVTPSEASGYFPLASGTTVRVEIVSIQPGASVKIGASVLDASGESAQLGTAPSLHVHPSWQLTLPQGALEQRSVSFRLLAPGSSYAASATYSLVLSTYAVTTTTSSTSTTTLTTSTSTTTSTAEPFCGDGVPDIPLDEECDDGEWNGSKGVACLSDCRWGSCGDVDHNGSLVASDALYILRGAVGSVGCDACLCDTRISVVPLTASDAQAVLRRAVGGDVGLLCPPCA